MWFCKLPAEKTVVNDWSLQIVATLLDLYRRVEGHLKSEDFRMLARARELGETRELERFPFPDKKTLSTFALG